MVSIVGVFGVLKLDSNRQQRNESVSITAEDDSKIIEEEGNEQVNIEVD